MSPCPRTPRDTCSMILASAERAICGMAQPCPGCHRRVSRQHGEALANHEVGDEVRRLAAKRLPGLKPAPCCLRGAVAQRQRGDVHVAAAVAGKDSHPLNVGVQRLPIDLPVFTATPPSPNGLRASRRFARHAVAQRGALRKRGWAPFFSHCWTDGGENCKVPLSLKWASGKEQAAGRAHGLRLEWPRTQESKCGGGSKDNPFCTR